MTERELPIYPSFPEIITQDEAIRSIVTEIAFGENAIARQIFPAVIDTVFCFGSNEGHKRQGQSLAQLFNSQAKINNLLLTSGMDWKLHKDVPDLGQSIAMSTLRAIGPAIPDDTMIGIEAESTNTKDNAVMGWAAMVNPNPPQIAISALAFHIGRCHRTLMAEAARHRWNGDIFYYPYQALEQESDGSLVEITSADWWEHPIAGSRVWGEVQRIHKYGARGDVAFLAADEQRFEALKQAGLELGL